MKVYVKINERGEYHSLNFAVAAQGFYEMGAEIVKYEKFIDMYEAITDEDIAIDYIDPCQNIFHKFGKEAVCPNYPEYSKPFLKRKVWNDTIDHFNSHPELWGVFIKPIKEKAFDGRVVNTPKDLIGCGSCYENYEILCLEPLDLRYECRGFIYYDELIDIRPYKGDWHYPLDMDVVDAVMEAFRKWKDRPNACSIDFASTKDGQTVFLEQNDAYALGCYGLYHIDYAKLISARWSQIMEREDEFDFRRYK